MLGSSVVEGALDGFALGAAVIMLGLLLGAELVLGFWLPRLEGFPDGALLGSAIVDGAVEVEGPGFLEGG